MRLSNLFLQLHVLSCSDRPLGQVFRCHGYGLEIHLNQGAEMGMGLGVDRPVRNVRIYRRNYKAVPPQTKLKAVSMWFS